MIDEPKENVNAGSIIEICLKNIWNFSEFMRDARDTDELIQVNLMVPTSDYNL